MRMHQGLGIAAIAGLLFMALARAAQGPAEKDGGKVLMDAARDLLKEASDRISRWWKELPAHPPERKQPVFERR